MIVVTNKNIGINRQKNSFNRNTKVKKHKVSRKGQNRIIS